MPENCRFYAPRDLHGRDEGARLAVAYRLDSDRPHAAPVILEERVLCDAGGGRVGR